jgi:hypothetical protein
VERIQRSALLQIKQRLLLEAQAFIAFILSYPIHTNVSLAFDGAKIPSSVNSFLGILWWQGKLTSNTFDNL